MERTSFNILLIYRGGEYTLARDNHHTNIKMAEGGISRFQK